MEQKLFKAAVEGSSADLKNLLETDEAILNQVTESCPYTCLHIAAVYGHVEFAKEVVSRRPDMVLSATNVKKRTPLHMASLDGHSPFVALMLDVNLSASTMGDSENCSALELACRGGHIEVVKLFLAPKIMPLVTAMSDILRSSWLAAASQGHEEILKEILKVQPKAIHYVDEQGFSALHLCAEKCHTNLAKVLIGIDSDLCMLQDKEGRTPLHLGASKGWEPIIALIFSHQLDSAFLLTKQNDTILHLCIKSNKFDAFKFIVENFCKQHEIINQHDSDGNTILHLVAAKQHIEMVKYLVENTSINVNALNEMTLTALDIVTRPTTCNPTTSSIYNTLVAEGAKSGRQVERTTLHNAEASMSNNDNLQHQTMHVQIMVAVVGFFFQAAYSGVLSPPGGLHDKEGSNMIWFRVFKFSNDLALFSSLGLIALINFICTRQQVLTPQMSSLIYKFMCACVAFMAVAYTSASWVICIPGQSNQAMLVTVTMAACCLLGSIFIGFLPMKMKMKIRQCMVNSSYGHHTSPWAPSPSPTITKDTGGNQPSNSPIHSLEQAAQQEAGSGGNQPSNSPIHSLGQAAQQEAGSSDSIVECPV